MSSRVTRSRAKQQPSESGGEQTEQKSVEPAPNKRASVSGRKRKGKNSGAGEQKAETETETHAEDQRAETKAGEVDLTAAKAESEPTLQLEAAGEGDEPAKPGQQLKLVTSDDMHDDADKANGADKQSGEGAHDEAAQQGEQSSAEDAKPKAEEEKSSTNAEEEYLDGHDDDTDYHEPQSPTQLVTLQQTDHRTAADGAPPTLPEGTDLSVVSINRAPVLTLWAAVLAHVGPAQLPWLSALTVGKAIAGMIAQARGRSLGTFDSSVGNSHKRQKTEQEKEAEASDVQVMGIKVHMARVGEHSYATISNKPVNASQVDSYIHSQFATHRPRVLAVMNYLARCMMARGADGEADVAGRYAFTLYETFRPNMADGSQPGWGQKGELDLRNMAEMGKNELHMAKTEGKQLHLTTEQGAENGGEKPHSEQTQKQEAKQDEESIPEDAVNLTMS